MNDIDINLNIYIEKCIYHRSDDTKTLVEKGAVASVKYPVPFFILGNGLQ
jgi:hypothetical protein